VDDKKGWLLAAYRKAAGDSKKLLERPYPDTKSVEEAGDIALECGKASSTLRELEEFQPVLNGKIRYVTPRSGDRAEQAGPWHHLYNKMVQGFTGAGGIKNEDDAVACAALLVKDEGWLEGAEQELLKAAVPVLRSPSAVVDFMFNLKSDRAVETMKIIMNMPRAAEAKK